MSDMPFSLRKTELVSRTRYFQIRTSVLIYFSLDISKLTTVVTVHNTAN